VRKIKRAKRRRKTNTVRLTVKVRKRTRTKRRRKTKRNESRERKNPRRQKMNRQVVIAVSLPEETFLFQKKNDFVETSHVKLNLINAFAIKLK
jgi:hypothetical protein